MYKFFAFAAAVKVLATPPPAIVLKALLTGSLPDNTSLPVFLTNFKLRGADLKKLKSQFTSNWFKKLFENQADKRARAFIEIFETIYVHYQQKLESENRVDFEDMLLKGKKYINDQNISF